MAYIGHYVEFDVIDNRYIILTVLDNQINL